MNLEELAQKAMGYLDSVGVAADYTLRSKSIIVSTDRFDFWIFAGTSSPLELIERRYPRKSPG